MLGLGIPDPPFREGRTDNTVEAGIRTLTILDFGFLILDFELSRDAQSKI